MREMVILIVDDNPKNLKLVRDLLLACGYKTLQAYDGEVGVESARSHQPDLILMDIQMPGMDGITAMKILKRDKSTLHIPVVALTAQAMKGDKERFLVEGFDDYVSKPIDIDQILNVVSRNMPSPVRK